MNVAKPDEVRREADPLAGRSWFLNLRIPDVDRPFTTKVFSESVTVLRVTSTYIIVQDAEEHLAVIPWSAIAFLASSSFVGGEGR